MSNEHPARGKHCAIDVCNCDQQALIDSSALKKIMHEEIEKGGATILDCVVREFEPAGCTIAFVLAESHATIHTYPEDSSYMMDVFTCGDTIDPELIAISIANRIGGHYRHQTIDRGFQSSYKGLLDIL